MMHSRESNPFISAVFTAHNPGRFLRKFLASLERQAYDQRNIELVFVDQGSTNGSAEILDDWASAEGRNVKVIRQSNQWIAVARNTGLAAATARWITFPDADDEVHEAYFAQANKFIRMHGPDEVALMTAHELPIDSDQHPRGRRVLDHRFEKGSRVMTLVREPIVQMSVHSSSGGHSGRRGYSRCARDGSGTDRSSALPPLPDLPGPRRANLRHAGRPELRTRRCSDGGDRFGGSCQVRRSGDGAPSQ